MVSESLTRSSVEFEVLSSGRAIPLMCLLRQTQRVEQEVTG